MSQGADPQPLAAGAGRAQRAVDAEAVLYAFFAGALTLWVATRFYSSLRLQTLYSAAGASFDTIVEHGLSGDWSAPLDDVFIHFDFARATARGFPFQWSEGNGYSSGGTSLLYPFVLALGYWAGFRSLSLMIWAGIIACTSVFALLLASRRMFAELPRFTSYLGPLCLLSVGALSWSLFSGMEVALFLALWGGALIAWDDLRRAELAVALGSARWRAALLGLVGGLVVATRPEGAMTIAILGVSAAWIVQRRRGRREGIWVLGLAGAPAASVVLLQALFNRLLTGDSTAAGALVKLEMHHPYMSRTQVWDAWVFHLKYQVLRVTDYHFADQKGWGWIVWGLAVVPLFSARTRRYALLLWGSAASWVMVVALNGQVRWQNERYTMPATAWLLLLAALGLALLLSGVRARGTRRAWLSAASVSAGVLAASLFFWHQLPRYREQIWFFGRASRNIYDQHVRAAVWMRRGMMPPPKRVLIGDAGAIPYMADLPALDVIGLGGYRGLPFARASRLGVASAIELIERLPNQERPDVLALYPSWWGVFPTWFGRRVEEFPVFGNVICGGASKVIYRADFTSLEGSASPLGLGKQERVVDTLDFADVVNEDEHDFRLAVRPSGYVHMKLLPNPKKPDQDLWDAGRLLSAARQSFRLRGFTPDRVVRLLFRVAPAQAARVEVKLAGQALGELELSRSDSWQEVPLSIPAERVSEELVIELRSNKGDAILYHLFAVQ